jgi:hypothetical protein
MDDQGVMVVEWATITVNQNGGLLQHCKTALDSREKGSGDRSPPGTCAVRLRELGRFEGYLLANTRLSLYLSPPCRPGTAIRRTFDELTLQPFSVLFVAIALLS